ncbi:MAG: SDR family oxidoreductase [Deltaproteobacteria bacterium]|nr:SDR family oxidoreductase [Deltaproteobacteria bacterium]MBI2364766.1 SDR family oxidoreductase [Deltaproteobacteria bacterium]
MGKEKIENIVVTGGAGYVGAILVPKLLDQGYRVRVIDLFLFGHDVLPEDHPRLERVEGDIRDQALLREVMSDQDAVIHLACISNDPSFELNPALSRSINYECFEPLVRIARDAGVRRFIYASTSSVYGISDSPNVTEDHPLVPLTDYNKYKGMCEPILLKHHSAEFVAVIIRPATVCGYSPRLRLDLTVNIFTNHAISNRKILVFGGSQKRPNIHIDDIAELYVDLLTLPADQISGRTFNAAYENHSIAELAGMVQRIVSRELPELGPIALETVPTNDMRSYHVSSARIRRELGWAPKRTLEDAVVDLCRAFRAGKIPDSMTNIRYYNVKTIQASRLSRLSAQEEPRQVTR